MSSGREKRMNSKEIQKTFFKSYGKEYEMVVPNAYLDWKLNEMDILARKKSGFIEEFEIKVSKSDYKADYKKMVTVNGEKVLKHKALKSGDCHCNRFSFLIPEGLLDISEIPEEYGVYFVKEADYLPNGHYIWCVRKGKILHRRKITDTLKASLGVKMHYRFWNLFCGRANGE
jgi:hypothetical protein